MGCMSDTAETPEKGPNTSIYAIDVPAIMAKAEEMIAAEVKFTFTTDGKNITFAASVPDDNSLEIGYKVARLGALADLLIEHAYRREGYSSDCEDEDKHDKWDRAFA